MSCLLIFASCASNSEEIWIESDGSGRYQSTQDASSMVPLLKMAMMSDEMKKNANSEDSNPFTDLFKSGNKIDTTFRFWQIMEDEARKKGETVPTRESLKEKMMADEKGTEEEKEMVWKVMEGFMDMDMRMQVDLDNDLFKMTMSQDFSSLDNMMFSNFGDMLDLVSKYDEDFDASNMEELEMAKSMMGSMPKYELTNNTLTISREPIDLSKLDDETRMGLEMMKGFMSNNEYTTTIHLPGKVKGVSQKNATYKGSTVTWTLPFDAMYDKNANLDLEVKFKGKKRKKNKKSRK